MKAALREVRDAPDRTAAHAAVAVFAEKHEAKYPKAVTCLTKDQDALPAFFDFPAEPWDHLRTAHPVESVFATVRHRTARTKEALSQATARPMVFKLVMAMASPRRRGAASRARTACRWSSPASPSPMASPTRRPIIAPPDRAPSPKIGHSSGAPAVRRAIRSAWTQAV